ncbi:MAG: MFS transporter [Firmicutes bacterium]|nr:MFS transporter [Bacillota bacterium]
MNKKLSVKTKIGYGIGCVCDNTLYTLSGTYLLLYLTTVAGVQPALAGTISAVGSVWEALVGPIMGSLSDNTVSRFGKRKPFMMFAAIPVAVITSLLFTAINAGPVVKGVYYTVAIILFWTSFSMEFVPYMSWGADLTDDYHERTSLRAYSYVFGQVGMLIGMVLPTIIVDWAMNIGKTTQQSWQLVGMFCGISAGAALLISALSVKNTDMAKDDPELIRMRAEKKAEIEKHHGVHPLKRAIMILKEFASILKLKPMRYLLAASMLYLIANTLFSSDRVFFMTYNMGMSQKEISFIMLVITFSGILFVPFISALSRRTDKKTVFMAGIGLAGVMMMAMRAVRIDGLGGIVAVSLMYSVANTCYWQLMPSMIYDIAEIEEMESGESHAGAVISFQALSESVCIAIGLQILGIILELSGFDESLPSPLAAGGNEALLQPESALTWVSNSFTLLPGIFMVLVGVVMLGYPVTEKSLEALRLKKK